MHLLVFCVILAIHRFYIPQGLWWWGVIFFQSMGNLVIWQLWGLFFAVGQSSNMVACLHVYIEIKHTKYSCIYIYIRYHTFLVIIYIYIYIIYLEPK